MRTDTIRFLIKDLVNLAPTAVEAIRVLKEHGTRCMIHQPKYSMIERWVEGGLLDVLEKEGIGCIPFSPLAQGLLTNKYLNGIPEGSRAAKSGGFLTPEQVVPSLEKVIKRNKIALKRGQTLTQMALVWLLKNSRVTFVLIGVRSVTKLDDNVSALKNRKFTKEELELILASKNSTDPIKLQTENPDEKISSRSDFVQNLAKRINWI